MSNVVYWFDFDKQYLPATILASIVVMMGIFAFIFSKRNELRKPVLGIWIGLIAVSILIMVAGLCSSIFQQPPYVRDTLLLIGFVSTCILIPMLFVIRIRYEKASLRKMHIHDLN
jgi:tellurite resistance protein TehA-like permease